MRLANLAVIVTGSTTGIGQAIARRCVAEGARVLIHGRDRERGQALAAELGSPARFHQDDLADPESAPRIVAAALAAFGRLDAIVNNAAIVTRSNIDTTTNALCQSLLQVNVLTPLLLIQAALPELAKTKGAVLNIGSVNSWCGEANLLAYSISKGALTTLSRNLGDALHRDHGVRVNQFNVGWVLTENEYQIKRADGLPADWPSRLDATVAPSGRIMQPEEIATIAVPWIGHETRPVSGTVMELEQYPILGRNPPKEISSAPTGCVSESVHGSALR